MGEKLSDPDSDMEELFIFLVGARMGGAVNKRIIVSVLATILIIPCALYHT